jgi:hypothetical protein
MSLHYAANALASASSFTIKPTVSVTVGRDMVSLYPQVDPTFGIAERSHAYHTNVNSLKNSTIKSIRVQLTTLGRQCGQTATTDGEIQTFLQRLHDQWCDLTAAAGMQILSFHNSMGAVIPNTTTAADPMILLPLQNGNINQCRAADIRFVRLQCNISFRDKITTAGSINTFRYEYYIELPQTTHNLTNGNNQPYQLTTWGGVDDLRTLTGAVVRRDILAHTLQVGPAQLIAPAFASTRATLETSTARIDIEESLLRMAYDQIGATLLEALAPNFTTQPHVIIDQVRQVRMSEDGKWECMSVHDYFTQFSAATMPFNFMTTFPIDVCAKFKLNLDPALHLLFQKHYPNHSQIVPLDATTQRATLHAMHQAAQLAEQERESILSIVTPPQAQAQAYIQQGQQTATVLQSQAETTLSTHSPGKGKRRYGCHGCGSTEHGWMTYNPKDGTKVITCPNANSPGVKEQAEADIKAMIARQQSKRTKWRSEKKERDKKKKTDTKTSAATTFAALSAEEQTRVMANYKATSPPSGPPSNANIFVVQVESIQAQVFNTEPPKRALPIAISKDLPHVVFLLGNDVNDSNCIGIRVGLDTLAALNTGNAFFFLSIIKKFPSIVHKIHGPEGYDPITLSGVVATSAFPITTTLPMVLELHLPYKSKIDGESSLIQFAVGANVAVNAIVGKPTLRKIKGIIDLGEGVFEAKIWDTAPFPIDFRHTGNHVPLIDRDAPVTLSDAHVDVVKEACNLENYFRERIGQSPPQRTVQFGSAPPPHHAASALSANITTDEAARLLLEMGERQEEHTSVLQQGASLW